MKRRDFVAWVAGTTLMSPYASQVQPSEGRRHISILKSLSRSVARSRINAFEQGLQNLGYFPDRNISLDFRYADGKIAELPRLAGELVRAKVNVLFAASTPSAMAAKSATDRIPIVFATVADPIGAKLVGGLSHPGGNITGLTTN